MARPALSDSKKAMIAMSGGVDSSVAALLMLKSGFECEGATMKLFSEDEPGIGESGCCKAAEGVRDARVVAEKLGIPYHVFDYSGKFREHVIEKFVTVYKEGATPNPCIDCNRWLKFGEFMAGAEKAGCHYIATGHYAVIGYDEASERFTLKKGADRAKDQSYVLYSLTQEQLARTFLPLGALHKSEVREIAMENDFVNAKRQESQDICFVADGDYAAFIERYTGVPNEPGDFIDEDGRVVGRHKGIVRYTVGQHKKLGLSLPETLYVCEKRQSDNTVRLGREEELYSKTATAGDINLIACGSIDSPMRVSVKVRYRQKEQPATVVQTGPDTLCVEFDEPQRAVARGQALVMYDGDYVVGGGTIMPSRPQGIL